jgi:hypothetical protein
MKRLIYILKKIITMDYQRMVKFAIKSAKKHQQPVLSVFIDMIKCSFVYGSGYSDYYIYNFPMLDAKQRATFVTIRRFDQIILTLNDKQEWDLFENKFLFNQRFTKYLGRFWCDIRTLTFEQYSQLFVQYQVLIIKPHDGISGKGIRKLTKADKMEFTQLQEQGPFLLEECIKQGENLAQFNPSSINTLRLQTLIKSNGEVELFSGVLRIGVGDTIVDNAGSGGIYTLIYDNGRLYPQASNDDGDTLNEHPVSKIRFDGFMIENYAAACSMVLNAALLVPSVRFVGWDVAMGQSGPVIIEGNQCPGYDMTQNTNINQKLSGDVEHFLELCPEELAFLNKI